MFAGYFFCNVHYAIAGLGVCRIDFLRYQRRIGIVGNGV